MCWVKYSIPHSLESLIKNPFEVLLSNPSWQWDILRSVKLIIHSRFSFRSLHISNRFFAISSPTVLQKALSPPFISEKKKKVVKRKDTNQKQLLKS